MNILIPMAGEGSRFRDAGYKLPKPLVSVHGVPMIERVVSNLGGPNHKFIFVVQQRHVHEFALDKRLHAIAPGSVVVGIDGPTSGAAVSALTAESFINDEPLLIANSDQLVDGLILPNQWADNTVYVFESDQTKWSYAALDEENRVWGVAEKQVISRYATCGIYYWRRGVDFVKYAKQMVKAGRRCNGEFYIAPVFNEAIADGEPVSARFVRKMWGVGTPEDLKVYEDAHRS